MGEPRTRADTGLLSARPDYSAVQDGVEHLDGPGCLPESASAIRLLDAQNAARGREIERLNAAVADLTEDLAAAVRTLVAAAGFGDRWRSAFDALHARLLRDLPGDASELPPPNDEYWARQLDGLLTFAAQLAHETETGAGTVPADTDKEGA